MDDACVKKLKETNACPKGDLSGVNLSEENLSGANLQDASLMNARTDGPVFCHTKLPSGEEDNSGCK